VLAGEAAERANKRRPRWHRLPYGVPLCIGFLACLALWYGA
jgi:prepilin peptidase CpaA